MSTPPLPGQRLPRAGADALRLSSAEIALVRPLRTGGFIGNYNGPKGAGFRAQTAADTVFRDLHGTGILVEPDGIPGAGFRAGRIKALLTYGYLKFPGSELRHLDAGGGRIDFTEMYQGTDRFAGPAALAYVGVRFEMDGTRFQCISLLIYDLRAYRHADFKGTCSLKNIFCLDIPAMLDSSRTSQM